MNELQAGKCSACGYIEYPLRDICRKCKSTSIEMITLPTNGTIYSYTVVRYPLKGLENPPYIIGLIELDNGVRLLSRISGDIDSVQIGKRVKLSEVTTELTDKMLPPFLFALNE